MISKRMLLKRIEELEGKTTMYVYNEERFAGLEVPIKDVIYALLERLNMTVSGKQVRAHVEVKLKKDGEIE